MTDNDFRKRGGRPGNAATRLTRRAAIARLAALGLAVLGATTLTARTARAGLQAVNVGVEATLFTGGIIPGDSLEVRVTSLISAGDQLGEFYQNLNNYLEQATSAARAVFGGDLTYSAGPWEWGAVDWSRFDFVGLDHYRDASNEASYVDELRAMRQHGKPIIVTEFGCCCYEGAEDRGGDGYAIIDFAAPFPELDGAYVRSERVQADCIAELLGIFAAEAVHGAFVWTFIEESPYSPDPRYDLDMACFGIVKIVPDSGYPPPPGVEFTPPGPGDWEPKLAFDELARLNGAP